MGEVSIIRETDDPLALRASIGGGKTAGKGNYYLVHRGPLSEVVSMLRDVLAEAERAATKEPRRPQG